MRNRYTQLLLLVSFLQFSYAQHDKAFVLGLQANYVAPGSDMKYALKPTVGIELKLSSGEIDNRFKFGVALGYCVFKPTQDTFRIYGTQTGGTASNGVPVNGTLLQPGFEHIYNYKVASIGFWSDFKILSKKFSPTLGLDFYAYVASLNEDYTVEWQISLQGQNENETTYSFAFIPKAGLSYELKDNWLFAGGMGRSMAFYGSETLRSFWKSYISVLYYF